MNKKILFLISISLLIITVAYYSNSGRVTTVETKEFTKSLLESNPKVLKLKFYFRRPSLCADIVYNGDLEKEDFKCLINEFKTLIDIDFMQEIGNKYWNGSRPNSFVLRIDIGEDDKNSFDYEIYSNYNKTKVHDEEPNNIDGYETWYIEDKNSDEIILNLSN